MCGQPVHHIVLVFHHSYCIITNMAVENAIAAPPPGPALVPRLPAVSRACGGDARAHRLRQPKDAQ